MLRGDVAIVSTSIGQRPEAYAHWTKAGQLIVAGDRNSPPELQDYVNQIGGQYMTPSTQDFAFSASIGWNCIQRRNAAIFQALLAGYPYILTVDDDNTPMPDANAFVDGHVLQTTAHTRRAVYSVIGSTSGWVNPGGLCVPRFHARGVPYGVNTAPRVEHWSGGSVRVVVSQAQVIGDPDCDAVERICNRPKVSAVAGNAVIRPGAYCAFNSQATLWTREWAPVMAVLPGIGRYDDIFAAFLFARLARTYDVTMFVGEPVVTQVRNAHDLASDLRAERWGMDHVFDFCYALDRAHISSSMPLWEAYENLIIATAGILPSPAVEFAQAWVREWKKL